jgi:hypothetical protein
MRVTVLFKLFRVCNLLLETIRSFESQILFGLLCMFTLFKGNAILKQSREVSKNASREEFTSEQL